MHNDKVRAPLHKWQAADTAAPPPINESDADRQKRKRAGKKLRAPLNRAMKAILSRKEGGFAAQEAAWKPNDRTSRNWKEVFDAVNEAYEEQYPERCRQQTPRERAKKSRMTSFNVIVENVDTTDKQEEHQSKMNKVFDIYASDQGKLLILAKDDVTVRQVFLSAAKKNLKTVYFPKYVHNDAKDIIEKSSEEFRREMGKLAICNQEIYAEIDFGLVEKVIIFDLPEESGRFKKLVTLLEKSAEAKNTKTEIYVLSTDDDVTNNLLKSLKDSDDVTSSGTPESPKIDSGSSQKSYDVISPSKLHDYPYVKSSKIQKSSGNDVTPSKRRLTPSPEFDVENMKKGPDGKYYIPPKYYRHW